MSPSFFPLEQSDPEVVSPSHRPHCQDAAVDRDFPELAEPGSGRTRYHCNNIKNLSLLFLRWFWGEVIDGFVLPQETIFFPGYLFQIDGVM